MDKQSSVITWEEKGVKWKMNPKECSLPLMSIITPSLNGANFIEEAINSVMAQDYPNVEHIIVDGGSTDSTPYVLERYSHLRAIFGPDLGIYDAINKGIAIAQGEIIGILNTDDLYEPRVFPDVARQFAEDDEVDMVYGGATVFEVNAAGERKILFAYLSSVQMELSLHNVINGAPNMNARFVRKSFYDRIGEFNTSYRIAGDRDMFLRATIAGVKGIHLNQVVCHYRRHDRSLTYERTSRLRPEWAAEHMDIAERHLSVRKLDSEIQAALKYWHSRETSVVILASISDKEFMTAVRYSWRGCRFDAMWPLRFWQFFITQKLPSYLRGRRRTFSLLKTPVTDPRWVWRKIDQRVIHRFVVLFLLKKLVTEPRWVWRKIDQRVIHRFAVLFVLKKLVTDPRWVWRKIDQRVIHRFVVLFLLKKLVTDPRWVWRKSLVRLGVRSRDAD